MLTAKIQGGESVPPRLIEFDQSPCYPEFRNSLVRSMRGRSTVSCTRGCTSVFACPAREEGRRVGVVRRGGGRGQARSIKPPPPSSPLEVSGAAYEKWFRQRWRWQRRTRKGGCIDSAKPHRSLRRPPSSSSFSPLLHISLKVPWPLELRRRLHSWHAATWTPEHATRTRVYTLFSVRRTLLGFVSLFFSFLLLNSSSYWLSFLFLVSILFSALIIIVIEKFGIKFARVTSYIGFSGNFVILVIRN